MTRARRWPESVLGKHGSSGTWARQRAPDLTGELALSSPAHRCNCWFDRYKAHLSVDLGSELIEDLLASHADDEVEPTVMGDCPYGTAETLDLDDAGA